MRCYRCREYDHFASECPNTPTDEETDYEDADPTSLQKCLKAMVLLIRKEKVII